MLLPFVRLDRGVKALYLCYTSGSTPATLMPKSTEYGVERLHKEDREPTSEGVLAHHSPTTTGG
jgi:hypothetical protein